MVIDTHIHPALFAPICRDEKKLAFRCEEMNYHRSEERRVGKEC